MTTKTSHVAALAIVLTISRVAAFNPGYMDPSSIEYLIVTSEILAPSWVVLAEWKTLRGVPAEIVTMAHIDSTNPGRDRAERLRVYLKRRYSTGALKWVLLGGDGDHVPIRIAHQMKYEENPSVAPVPTDMYFAALDGTWDTDGNDQFGDTPPDNDRNNLLSEGALTDDIYADIFVGRVPATFTKEVDYFVAKLLRYEQNPPLSYLNDVMIMAAAPFKSGESAPPMTTIQRLGQDVHRDFLDGWDIARHYSFCSEASSLKFYDWIPCQELRQTSALSGLKEGPHIVIHGGHAAADRLGTGFWIYIDGRSGGSLKLSDINGLRNEPAYSVVVSGSCLPGAFDRNSIGERFLFTRLGGAVAFVGNSRSVVTWEILHQIYDLFQAMWGYENPTFPLPGASTRFRERHGSADGHLGQAIAETWYGLNDRWAAYNLNLMGDPEMRVWHGVPQGPMALEHSGTFPGGYTVPVHVMNPFGDPVEGALVTAWIEGQFYERGFTSPTGDVVIPALPTIEDRLSITAHHPSFLPVTYYDSTWTGLRVTADFAPGARLESGLETLVDLVAKNVAPDMLGDLTGRLWPLDPLKASLTKDDRLEFLAVGATQWAHAENPLTIFLDSSLTAGQRMAFELELTHVLSGQRVFRGTLSLPVVSSDLRISVRNVRSTTGGLLPWPLVQPTEVVPTIVVKNLGNGPARDLRVRLVPVVAGLTFGEIVRSMAVLEAGDSLVVDDLTATVTQSGIGTDVLPLNVIVEEARRSHDPIAADIVPPPVPSPPTFTPGQRSAQLAWSSVTAEDVKAYHVETATDFQGVWRRETVAGPTPATSYELSTDPGGVWVRISAVDQFGNIGRPSTPIYVRANPPFAAGWPADVSSVITVAPSLAPTSTGDGYAVVVGGAAGDLQRINPDGQTDTGWPVFVLGTVHGTAVGDIDGDKEADVVAVVNGANTVYALSADGSFKSGWPKSIGRSAFGTPVLVEMNGDSILDVLMGSTEGGLFAWRGDGKQLAGWPVETRGGVFATPSTGDLDGDGYTEIVYASWSGEVGCLEMEGTMCEGWPVLADSQIFSSPTLAALVDGDMRSVLVGDLSGNVHVYGPDGLHRPGWPMRLPGPVYGSPIVADLDSDGDMEIVIGCTDGNVYVWHHDGDSFAGWERGLPTGDAVRGEAIAVDLNGDGLLDVAVSTVGGRVHGWGSDGKALDGWPLQTLATWDDMDGTLGPWAGDIDGDGDIDLMMAGRQPRIFVWDLPHRASDIPSQWPGWRGNSSRQGSRMTSGRSPVAVARDREAALGALPRPFAVTAAPNPSNPSVMFTAWLPQSGHLTVELYSTTGQMIRRWDIRGGAAGSTKIVWQTDDNQGRAVASAVYLFRATFTGDASVSKWGRLTVLR